MRIVDFTGAAASGCGMCETMSMHRRPAIAALSLCTALACGNDVPAADDSSSSSSSSSAAASTGDSSGSENPTSSSTGPANTTGEPNTSTSDTSETGETGDPPVQARCGDEPPPGATLAPEIPAYGGSCPALVTGFMDGQDPNVLPQQIGDNMYDRSFLVIVPEDLDPAERLPVMFMWHWLGGTAQDFYERGEVQDAVNRMRFLAVIPNGRDTDQGVTFKWPFSVVDNEDQMDAEFQFFDDMLACVNEQFNVDKECVSSSGVSAGALFTSQLAGGRGDVLASFLSLSGGTGGDFVQPWRHPAHKMPALVLWGGPNDFCVVIDFEETSHDLEQNLVEDGHFVLECQHNCNHSTPPFDVPEGMTAFAPLWDFMFAHPYWLEPGESPYTTDGLPPSMPVWCAVGVGNAVPPSEPCDMNECS